MNITSSIRALVCYAILITGTAYAQDQESTQAGARCQGPAISPAPGQIVVDRENPAWFRYHEGGPFFMSGPGDPEGFLYLGTRNPDGTRDGDQMKIINRMAGTGANCIYLMAIRSHGGDGDSTQNPYINSDLSQGLSEPILAQWETWFRAMDEHGIVIFFIFFDDDADPFGRELPADGELKPQTTEFIDAMVDRFKHHKHLIWCVAEEYLEGFTKEHAEKVAQRIRERDDRGHPIAIHQNEGTSFDFKGSPYFDQFAVQWNKPTPEELHAGTVAAWKDVEGRVNINIAEFMIGGEELPFSGTGEELRRKIWAIAMGGGYSMAIGMDLTTTPIEDLKYCGRLVRFMEATRFPETAPRNDLARAQTTYVLAKPGHVYIAYSETGSQLGLAMLAGRYEIKWCNPVTGTWVNEGVREIAEGDQVFERPAGFQNETALYLSNVP